MTKLLDPDRHFTQLRPDKAADPAEPGEHDSAAIAAQLADMRPHAVMLEYSGNVEGDTQAKAGTAWSAVAAQVRGDEENEASHKQLNITVGDRPVDQFKPLYMAVAFCWCFKFSVGLPDVLWKDTVTRDRRDALAPVVDIATWCQQILSWLHSPVGKIWFLATRRSVIEPLDLSQFPGWPEFNLNSLCFHGYVGKLLQTFLCSLKCW